LVRLCAASPERAAPRASVECANRPPAPILPADRIVGSTYRTKRHAQRLHVGREVLQLGLRRRVAETASERADAVGIQLRRRDGVVQLLHAHLACGPLRDAEAEMHVRPVKAHAHRRRVTGSQRLYAIHDGVGYRGGRRALRTRVPLRARIALRIIVADRGFWSLASLALLLLRGADMGLRIRSANRSDWRKGNCLVNGDRLITRKRPADKAPVE
jgi:hypothetical protein